MYRARPGTRSGAYRESQDGWVLGGMVRFGKRFHASLSHECGGTLWAKDSDTWNGIVDLLYAELRKADFDVDVMTEFQLEFWTEER